MKADGDLDRSLVRPRRTWCLSFTKHGDLGLYLKIKIAVG